MKACKICGSFAINPGQKGRGVDNIDLCDVCYWRIRVESLETALKFYAKEDAESVEEGILESVYHRPATGVLFGLPKTTAEEEINQNTF